MQAACLCLMSLSSLLYVLPAGLETPTHKLPAALERPAHKKDWRVRKAAVERLAAIKEPEAVKPLAAAVNDPNEAVRAEALEALVTVLRIGDARVRAAAAQALSAVKDVQAIEKFEPLIYARQDSDPDVRKAVANVLVEVMRWPVTTARDRSAAEVQRLLAALQDENAEVRAKAARALGETQDANAVAPLVAALRGSDAGVRGRAAWALGKIGAPAVAPLAEASRDADPHVRRKAVEALGYTMDSRAVEPLLGALKDSDVDVRKQAIIALGQIGDPRAVGPLMAVWEDDSSELTLMLRWEGAFKYMGRPAVKPLVAVLQDSRISAQIHAARALGELGHELLGSLTDSDSAIREAAAEALVEIGDAFAAQKKTHWLAQYPAAMALAAMEDPRAIEALVASLPSGSRAGMLLIFRELFAFGWQPQSEREHVYFWIATKNDGELNKAWEQTRRVLLADLRSGEEERIDNAVHAFIDLGNPDVVPALEETLTKFGDREMAEAYCNCGNAALRSAAEAWASRHGYRFVLGSGGDRARWGRRR